VLLSILIKYDNELDIKFGGNLRLSTMTLIQKIALGDDVITVEEAEFETIKKLLDMYGYDNVVYWNFIKA
jgi:PDZ domain-containing secreted protein